MLQMANHHRRGALVRLYTQLLDRNFRRGESVTQQGLVHREVHPSPRFSAQGGTSFPQVRL